MFPTEPVDERVGGHRSGWRDQQGPVPEARRWGTAVALVWVWCGLEGARRGQGRPVLGNLDHHGQVPKPLERRGWVRAWYLEAGDRLEREDEGEETVTGKWGKRQLSQEITCWKRGRTQRTQQGSLQLRVILASESQPC